MKSEALTLGNGLRVIIYPRPQLESVGIAVGVNYGSIDDPGRIGGAAHYLEHMLFKGTKKRSVLEITNSGRSLGYINATTTYETTIYLMQGYSGYFGRMMDLLSDMIKNSTLPERECRLEMGPVINENLMHQDNSRFFFYDNFGRVLYKRHPASRPVGGSRKSIERVTRADLLKIYTESYAPANMVVAIYGNVSLKSAKLVAARCFRGFKKDLVSKRRLIAEERQVLCERTIRRESLKQARIGVGFKCKPYARSSARELASMLVISKLLSYRLFDEIREKRGLSYDPSASYYPFSTLSFIGAQAGVEPRDIGTVKRIMIGEMRKLERGETTDAEVKKAKAALMIQYRVARENTLDMANSIASYALITGEWDFAWRLPGEIGKVSTGDIKRYCKRYIRSRDYSFLAIRPA
ncbi:MAG: insulinase family protein [Candidatus Marsarchaeota archaeon]|jgi:predicted Zn-dependent peptidase|nr:insulinase family protein [Candidatus Marsarchaeota archaeon]MCL5419314.1 insulinase family protein [Candidatus Marsarchaeota archaeon]